MAKIMAAILALALLLGISFTAAASADEVKWTRVDIPSGGRGGGWVLAPDSDTRYLAAASDGTLYTYGQGTSHTIYQSTDGGTDWAIYAEAKSAVVALVPSPSDADTIYYATENAVFRARDSGKSVQLGGSPGGAGASNITITAIDVTTRDDGNVITAATRDSDDGQFGGVYILDESAPVLTWEDTVVGSYDVYAVAFSPDYAADRQLVAVVTDEINTLVTTRIGTTSWGQTMGNAVLESSSEPVVVDISATIVFPDDYDTAEGYTQFVAIDTGEAKGDVYRIIGVEYPEPSAARDLDIGADYGLARVDVTGLAGSGHGDSAILMAGAAGSAEIYLSTDGGESWQRSTKPPTGEGQTYVLLDTEPDRAYAATSGEGSAVSISQNSGHTWNQNGLIDTEITSIIDLAPSPSYSQDETLFLLTWGGGHSLWRSPDGGDGWERVYSNQHANVDEIDRVALPPDYGERNETVFLAGSYHGQPAIWCSDDNGQEFNDRKTPLAVDTWAVASDRTLFIGGFDGSHGRVYRSTNGGLSYSTGVAVGDQPLHSLVLSPGYADDETILAGNTNGWVFLSEDNGQTFNPLPDDATTAPLTGSITVAFDPDFGDNYTIYAASDAPDGGIHRLRRDKDTGWESIDTGLPAGGMISQLKLGPAGTLYATNFLTDGGLERCLNPTYSLGPTFETVKHGLDEGATLVGLWIADNQLWSIDTTNNRLLRYTDSLAVPVTLTSPEDEAPGVGTVNEDTVSGVSLDWATLPGATLYRWQLDYDTDFSSVPDGFEGENKATSAHLPALDPATTYYWRVRAIEPVLSPWSAKWSFTTSLGTGISAPQPYTPKAGASEVNLRPVFQWSSIAGADSYELMVATDTAFENIVISQTGDQAVPATAWECDIDLSTGTTYFWKVRARGQGSHSAWSDVYAFTTAVPSLGSTANQPSSLAPAPPAKPETDWTQWLVVVGIALLVILVAILVTMIVMTTRMRRY